eukprot:TRINITY_DN9515_c0_g1_i4.p1 TRINITY_DN9515_c0_g1~~TRINITY_DN9515_c0_g1_i4.p1  ORF type:complete len:362 (+),score=33.52 TRINITY_DN9515_c0_g1_i4:100-1185(+)
MLHPVILQGCSDPHVKMAHRRRLAPRWWFCVVVLGFAESSLCPDSTSNIPPTNLTRFRWLHIPKAGTSFATVLYQYSCTGLPADATPSLNARNRGMAIPRFEREYDFNAHCSKHWFMTPRMGHHPLRSNEAVSDKPIMVAMFRDPRSRLWSAYNFGLHANGMHNKLRREMRAAVKTPRDFARWPRIGSCQTKMMLGHQCASDYNITEVLFQKAVQRLQNFAFIGITDDWDSSVCLFHAMFGGPLLESFFKNIRNTSESKNHQSYHQQAYGDQLSVEDDPYDWRLYLEAVRIYFDRLHKYGLHTAFTIPGLSESNITDATSAKLMDTKARIAMLQERFQKSSQAFDRTEEAARREFRENAST